MVARTVIGFFAGMTVLTLTVIVVETVWVVAVVGLAHIAGAALLGTPIVRHLVAEERGAAGGEER